jgi:hypothetical protein
MGLTNDKTYSAYQLRTAKREKQLFIATMEFVAYFMSLGDDHTLYAYVLGRTQPLIDAINASTLPFMDAAAKAKLTGDLTITP